MALPCPKCGKPATCGTFCKECIKVVYPLVVSCKPARIVLCALCDKIKPHSDWKNWDYDYAISQVMAPAIQFSSEAKITSVEFKTPEFEKKPGIKKTVDVFAVVTGHHEDAKKDYEEEYDFKLDYEVTLCDNCKRKGSSYFEGILQIRNQNPRVRADIFSYLEKNKPKGLRLAKEVPVGNGSDYFLSSQRAVSHLAKQLYAKYGGELQVNAQHFSYNHTTSKNLYRVNAYLEVPDFFKGDVIRIGDDYYLVRGISGTIKCENLLTGQEEQVVYNKGEPVRLAISTTQVASTKPLEVIHPKDYSVVPARISKYVDLNFEINQGVSVAYDGHEMFVIPTAEERDVVIKKKKRHSQKRGRKDIDRINPD